jgi:hypothetical protein
MRKPLIFISHSAKDTEARSRLDAIVGQLTAAGFRVLLDRKRLQGGNDWRRVLHTWMGHCDAAIALLTPGALQSPWVLKECTILSWRNEQQSKNGQERFFIPVFAGVSEADLLREPAAREPDFRPLSLTDVQALNGLDAAEVAQKLSSLLAPLKAADTPLRLIEEKLANLLRPAGDQVLARVMEDLDEEADEEWQAGVDKATAAARQLLQAPYGKLPPVMKRMAGVGLPRANLIQAINILEAFWVEPNAAAMLDATTRAPLGSRAAMLNAQNAAFTVGSYIGRAGLTYPRWRSVLISPVGGENLLADVSQTVFDAMAKRADATDPEEIREYFLNFEQYEPTLVVVPPAVQEQLSATEFGSLLTTFDYCTFVVTTGAALPGQTVLPEARRIRPELDSGIEKDAKLKFQTCRDLAGTLGEES